MVFRLIHYLPIVHLALGFFAVVTALLVMTGMLMDITPRGIEPLLTAAKICRWLVVFYLLITGLLQYRLSRSGHSILAQPSRLWVIFVAEQILLLVLLAGVLVRGPTSRLYLSGLHQAVSALLIVALLSLALAAIDRFVARRLTLAIPEWDEDVQSRRAIPLGIGFIIVSGLLFLSIGYLESHPLPHTTRRPPTAQAAGD